MSPSTLNCPTCGAAISSDSPNCPYCSSRLATISCPSCFSLAFLGSKFCPHCGHPLTTPASPTSTKLNCPHCLIPLEIFDLGQIKLRDCPKCCGIWVDTKTFQQICADREDQAAILGSPIPVPRDDISAKRAYIPCPQCRQLMSRSQFSRRSGIIIDLCRAHGVWFDRDELRHIIEFIRSGGLDRAREMDKEDLDRARRDLDAQLRASARDEDLRSIASTGGLLTALLHI